MIFIDLRTKITVYIIQPVARHAILNHWVHLLFLFIGHCESTATSDNKQSDTYFNEFSLK